MSSFNFPTTDRSRSVNTVNEVKSHFYKFVTEIESRFHTATQTARSFHGEGRNPSINSPNFLLDFFSTDLSIQTS